jgi:hypothetical protein
VSIDGHAQFTRNVEDFTCQHCGAHVTGTGYTNHCPRCLWSKHVDIHPGDRRHECQGLMEPIRVEQKQGKYVIVQRCGKCGEIRQNVSAANDDFAAILAVAARHAGQ